VATLTANAQANDPERIVGRISLDPAVNAARSRPSPVGE
jgi:hypothetical protein